MEEEDESKKPTSEISVVIGALLDTLNDKDETVKQSAVESIRKISKKNGLDVVQAAALFYSERHQKMSNTHLASVLKIMTDSLQYHVTSLDDDLATSVADLALAELAGNSDDCASELMVALSKTQCSQAVGALIIKFEPNIIPSHKIIKALGMIAEKNSVGVLPFIKVTLSVLVPLLQDMNDEPLKLASTFTLERLSDAISDCLNNTEITSNTGLNKEIFFEELSNAFEILTFSWLRTSRTFLLTESILTSLASILPLLPKVHDESLIIKLIPILLNLIKRSNVRLAASRVLSLILNSASNDVKESLRPNLEQIHQVLLDYVSISPFEAEREALKTHFEVLQCFKAVVFIFPEEGLDRILQQLKGQNVTLRSKALVVLRFLINTLPAEDDAALQRIALSLQDSLSEGSTRHVVGVIVALAARPTFPLLPSQRSTFIKFMVLHCGTRTDEAIACDEALYLLSSTVEGAETWLWPSLIKALLDPSYATSAVSILRALSPLPAKIIRDENNLATEKDFQSIKVFGRCLELMEDERNRPAVITFLKSSAPLFGHQLKTQWDTKLQELSKFLDQSSEAMTEMERTLIWEERIVEFLEESVNLEGETWGLKVADELVGKTITPCLSIFLAAVASNAVHITHLIEMARTHSVNASGQSPVADEYARAVGICSRRQLTVVLKIMEEYCQVEDAKKQPVRLLGLVRDTKAAATNEAAKAGLLRAYAEIARKGDAKALFPVFEKRVLHWIIRQLNDCKELTTKEAGLIALEQVGEVAHPIRLEESPGYHLRSNALATILGLFQTTSGYKPLQLYPLILKATISHLKAPPALTDDEREVLLETAMDKVIAASTEIIGLKMPQVMQQIIEGLSIISSETVSDSADTLALLVDILLPWMQSKSSAERKTTLLVLRSTLRTYHDSLKYTYPGGKLEPGKLLGRFLAWSADPDVALRPLVVDCVSLALNIGARHRSTVHDSDLNEDLSESKRIIINEDSLYEGVTKLASASCMRIASGEVVSLAEGLVEGLLYRGEGGVAAGIALKELFNLRGFDIPRTNLTLVDSVIAQIRQMDNASCKKGAAAAIKALSKHHPQDTLEHLLQQPLPLDRGTKDCWKELGKSLDIGSQMIELLLTKLESDNLLVENTLSDNSKRNTAGFPPLSAIVAVGQLMNSPKAEDFVEKKLAPLIGTLLKYLSGWLHVDPPMSIVSSKFGFVPNRESCKIVPHREVYSVLLKILKIIGLQDDNSKTEHAFDSESEAEENLVGTVHTVVQCLIKDNDVLISVARQLGKLVTSTLPAQRAVAVAFYTELIGKIDCDAIWLDGVLNTLHEAKSDSSPLVRKLATIGLTRVAYLKPNQVEEYFDSCIGSLLSGLEEPSGAEGCFEVILESLKGLSVLLSAKTQKPVSPRVVLALKPFIEKDNSEMKHAAISALGATATGWRRFSQSPDDDITDHLLGCIPCLVIKLEDKNASVASVSREVLCEMATLLQSKSLAHVLHAHLKPESDFIIEEFLKDLINCLTTDLNQRAEELRNSVVRGYSKSENGVTRATSALILGLFGEPRPEDVQRMLQLLRDQENFVRARAARGLALCFTV